MLATVDGATFKSRVHFAAATAFTSPGSHIWTVPAGVRRAAFDLYGGQGGDFGGKGAHVHAVLRVHPGESLTIMVAGQGLLAPPYSSSPNPGGFGGGGDSGVGSSDAGNIPGGGGGGASDVRTGAANNSGLTSRLVVAGGGGGGGAGTTSATGTGKPGSRTSGGAGAMGASGEIGCGRYDDTDLFFEHFFGFADGGGGGTFGAGAAGGDAGSSSPEGAPGFPVDGGGGGGGGYYGGGGGAGGYDLTGACADEGIITAPIKWSSGDGGDGSSYVTPRDLCAPIIKPGIKTGDGEVDITYNPRGC